MFVSQQSLDRADVDAIQRESSALIRFVLSIAYVSALIEVYIGLSRWWSYFGFNYNDPGLSTKIAITIVSCIPSVLLPRVISSFSKFIGWMLFYLVYIPASIVPYLQNYQSESDILLNHALLLVSVSALILLCRLDPRPVKYIPTRPLTFWVWVAAAYVAMNIYLVVVFGSTLSIASIDTVYDQRYLGAAALTGSYVGYAIGALSNAVNPFLIAVGFSRRKWIPLSAGIIGQVITFSTLALRATILSPIFIILMILLFREKDRSKGINLLLIFLATITFCLLLMPSYNPAAGGINEVVTLLSMRTLIIPGMTFGVYADFFSIYPLTYLSHANIFNLFISYPYGNIGLPEVVGQYIAPDLGNEVLGFNASFLATEGLASFGSLGIVISSLLMAGVIRVIGRVLQGAPINVLAACFVPFIVNISNSSMLTSLITGGGAALTIILYFWICSENYYKQAEL